MPFEPFYHRRDNYGYNSNNKIRVWINYYTDKDDKMSPDEVKTKYPEISKYKEIVYDHIKHILQDELSLVFVSAFYVDTSEPESPPNDGINVFYRFHYDCKHNCYDDMKRLKDNIYALDIRNFDPRIVSSVSMIKFVAVHELLHTMGIPHELRNPLVHYCLKPNWDKILNWEKKK